MDRELTDYSVIDFDKMNLRITDDRRLDFDTAEVVKQLCEARGDKAPSFSFHDVKGSDVEMVDFMLMHLYREKQALDPSVTNDVLEKYSIFQQTRKDLFSKESFDSDASRIATLKVLGALSLGDFPVGEDGMPGEDALAFGDTLLAALMEESEALFDSVFSGMALMDEAERRIVMFHFAKIILAKRNNEDVFEVSVDAEQMQAIFEQNTELHSITDIDGLGDLVQKAGAATIKEHKRQVKLGCKAFFADYMIAHLLFNDRWEYYGNKRQGLWLPVGYDFTEFPMEVEEENFVETAIYNRGAVEAMHLYNYGRFTMFAEDVVKLFVDIENAAAVDYDQRIAIDYRAPYSKFAIAVSEDYFSFAPESHVNREGID